MTTTFEKSKTYLSVSQLSQRHPAFSPSAIRHLIFDSKRNGFNSVIVRVGKKLVLEETAFEAWVQSQSQKRGE